MHKFTQNQLKKPVASISVAMIAATLIFQQNIALAMTFRGNERDILATDLTTPACSPNNNQSASDVAVSDNRRYAFVWEDDACDGAGNGTGVYIERYDLFNGPTLLTGPEQISTTTAGDQKNPSIAMDNSGNYVVAWQGNGTGDADGIFVRFFNSDGTPRGPEHLVNTHTVGIQDSPKVAIDFDANPVTGNEQQFSVVWHGEGDGDTEGIYLQVYKLNFGGDIVTVGSNIQVNTYTTGAQVDPDVAMNNIDETLVTWSGPGTGFPSTNEVWMQGYQENAVPWNGSENNIRVNSTSPATKPAVASNKSFESTGNTVPGGQSVIVYLAGADNQVYGKLVDRCSNVPVACALGNVELNINGVTSALPDVAMDYLGNFTATWEQDDTPEGQYMNIHAINYDYLGRRIDTQFRVNDNVYSDGSANQTDSAVAKDKDGEYFVSWTSPHSTQGNDVRYKNYGTDIFKLRAETLANQATTSNETDVVTAIAPNGNQVVAWVGQDQTSLNNRIFYSLYDDAGNIINGVQNIAADTVDDSSTSEPSVSFFKDTNGSGTGRFVMAWAGNDPNNLGNMNIMYREFDATGTPVTPTELPVASNPTDTYSSIQVKAGYYNDGTSTVIDRFGIIAYKYSPGTATTEALGIYHTETGFTSSSLEAGIVSNTYNSGIDIYPDINGNDKIIYTWETDDGSQNGIKAREANGASLVGSAFVVNNTTANIEAAPDVAFVSPVQYVITWTQCPNIDCTGINIYGSRYTGDFTGGIPAVTDDDFVVYPGGGNEQLSNSFSRIAADTSNGSFLIAWSKEYQDVGYREMTGKFFETAAGLANFGVGFVISTTPNGNGNNVDVDMNTNGRAAASWEGPYRPFDINLDGYGAVFQTLNNPTFVSTLPDLPTSAQLNITEGGKTLTIPSTIQFPSITTTTSAPTDVTREIDENPAAGQPLFFQLEDLGGNSTGCTPGPCYNVTISSTDFTYTDPSTGITYAIPSSDVSIQNYDGNHPGVAGTGICGSAGASQSLEAVFGDAADFSLDASSCDYASLDMNRTLINKITNNSDTARIRWYPKLKITVPPLTPPGTYTATFTITSV